MLIAALLVSVLSALAAPPAAPDRTISGVQLHPTTVPGRWEGNGLAADVDGVAWYVGEISL
jgi:hypothetical protein